MNNNYTQTAQSVLGYYALRRSFILVLLVLLCTTSGWAEGTQDVAPNPDDLVMLLIGDDNFANFATPSSPESSRLYISIDNPDEIVYLGLSREFTEAGNPASTGSYTFRIMRASDGEIAHGPYSMNAFVENISNWEEAGGPAILNGGVGYATDDDRFVFEPQEAGLYYVEFISADYIGYWDFTVAANGVEVPGRVFSKNWAFRTPTDGNTQPECVWDRRFNGALYSYTTDGFVTRIDFANSGFQGLSFTMAFNTQGPGQSGDLGLDRMSVPGANLDEDFAEHFIFLSEPDPNLYPDGECGQANVESYFTCTGPGTYCLDVSVTSPGQVELIIDINQNDVYDEGIDRRIIHRFDVGDPLNTCLDWDGRLGDGSPIDPGASVNLMVQYTQGVQHWTVYDGEFLKDGFCVEPIRPLCTESNGSTDILYWDDRNIPEEPGTGQPKDGRIGCDCETIGCRTWNNFDPQTEDCSFIEDSQTTGYGDKNALNTWWFANIVTESIANIPLIYVELNGEEEVCQGETTPLSFVFTSGGEIQSITWTGPNGVIAEGPDAPLVLEVSDPGLYTVEVFNENGCSFSDTHVLNQLICPADLELDITADDLTPDFWQTVTFTITVTNQGPLFAGDFTINTNWPAGITDVELVTPGGVINGNSIDWENLSLGVGETMTLVFTGVVAPGSDPTVSAEVAYSAQPDPDSTPGNGVDTNGNGECADDPGDEDDGDCVKLVTPGCTINAFVLNVNCFDNLTPADPSDDTYGFTLRVTSSFGSGTWTAALSNGQTISGNYGLFVTVSGFEIADGDLDIIITDDLYGTGCFATASVEAPPTCSDQCVLSLETEDAICDDNGTDYDPSDDTYSFRFRVSGNNAGNNWNASDGSSGEYGVWYTYSDNAIVAGDVNLTFTDAGGGECSISQTFTAPETCSSDCFLEVSQGDPICDPNSTLSDPSDDVFYFTVDITGWNVGSTEWIANDPNSSSGAYGTVVQLGPYPISGGVLNFTISDPTNPTCTIPVSVTPPNTCSDVCAVTLEESLIECQDNGTESDSDDDTFTVLVRITGANASDGWTASNGQSGAYGEWVTMGPFSIAGGDVIIDFDDNEIGGCGLTSTFAAPPSCSNTCSISAIATVPVCDDNDTPWDPSDDTYTFFLTVDGQNTAGGWTANDPSNTAGIYGQTRLMGPYPISDGDLSLIITDAADANCTATVAVEAPTTCSDECAIAAILLPGSTICNDNDTESDASDDTFTFTVIVNGFNTGGTWTASNGQIGIYGVETIIGPFDIADGAANLLFTDSADGTCFATLEVDAPMTCSDVCAITVVTTEAICDDQNTPWDPSDDTYTFFLTVQGFNSGTNWFANDPLNTTGIYGQPIQMGPYLISDGNLSLVIIDIEDASCTSSTVVVAPETCSDECAVSAQLTMETTECDDNGTPSDPSDDTFTFTAVITGFNTGDNWMASNGQSGAYGVPVVLGPFDIADGAANLTFTDSDEASCIATLEVDAPPSCSDNCVILEATYDEVTCDDNGTPTDPSDDTFTFVVELDGVNLGGNWVANDGTTGAYNTRVSFGPYNIGDGDVTLSFVDADDDGCTADLEIPAPPTCSDECLIVSTADNYQCFDNDTPLDPFDDVFTFDLTVTSVNNSGPGWIQPSGNSGAYGETYTQGPFLIADGPFNMIVQDVADATCTAAVIVNPPVPCSNECLILAEVINTACDDRDTPEDTSDDQFTYTILVNGVNTGAGWIASDGTTGNYGEEVVSVVGHDYSGGILELVITDIDGGCAETIEIGAPAPSLQCPEDTAEREYMAGVQVLEGELDASDELLEEAPCFLALSSTPILLGDRFIQPVDVTTPEPNSEVDTMVYNFFLFTNIPLDSELDPFGTADGTSMLFLGNYQGYDDPCCFNVNYGSNLGDDADMTEINPLIDTTGLFDQDMFLVQHFTQILALGQDYSLVMSTFSPGATGNYAWVIVTESNDPLITTSTEVVSEFYPDQMVSEDLTYFHIPWAQDEEESMDQLGYVVYDPICGVDTVYFSDQLTRDDDCEDSYITRTFTMEYGTLADSCDQEITFRRPDIDDIVLPPATVTYQCGDEYPVNDEGYPDPQDTGYPIVSDGEEYTELVSQVPYFNLAVSYKDIPDPDTSDLVLNLTREWNIIDECNGDTLYVFPQRIKIGQFGPPRLVCPTSTGPCSCPEENILIFGLDPFECTATVDIPLADLVGFCDESRIEDWSITTELIRNVDEEVLETIPFEAARSVSDLERGRYTLRYIAEDIDGNQVERQCQMRIQDYQQPTAVCNSSLTVTVEGDVPSLVLPDQLDNGSYDNCGTTQLLMRRFHNEETEDCNGDLAGTFGLWTEELSFDCCDAGETFLVELQVMDMDSNDNFCSVLLTVIDDVVPELSGLEPQNVMCSELPQNFEPMDSLQRTVLFGMPQVNDNCDVTVVEMTPELTWDNCQVGSITRKFSATDRAGNTTAEIYEQHIEVEYNNSYSIRFPKDQTTDCVAGLETLDFIAGGCGDFEISFTDTDLAPEGEECVRLQRTYTIINHCQYDGISAPVELSRDEDCDAAEGEDYLWLVVENGDAYADADSDASNAFPPAGEQSPDCGTNPVGHWRDVDNIGAWTYTQIIKITDDTAPMVAFDMPEAFCTEGPACEGAVNLTLDVLEQCLPERTEVRLFFDQNNDGTTDLDLTTSGILSNLDNRYLIDGDFPAGNHAFVVEAEDICGNIGIERIAFTVVDCYIDQPVCTTGVMVQLSPVIPAEDLNGDGILDEAAATLSAADLAEMAGLDCSGAYSYSISDLGEPADFQASELILTCEDRYQAIRDVTVRDNATNPQAVQPDGSIGGPNHKRCTVIISVQDEDEICSACTANELGIEGAVRTQAEEPLSGVQMNIFVDDVLSQTLLTIDEGEYEFPELEFSTNYTVRPYKNDDTAHGITTLDMIMLARHLNGQQVITDPYTLLAADIDANGVVDYDDFNYIGDLMLDRLMTWPNNTSWRFLPSDYPLTDISADIPDYIEYTALEVCQFAQDFIGIKIGDINGSLTSNGMLGQAEERNLGKWLLQVPAYQLQSGDLYRIPVRARDLELLSGLELAMELNTNGLRIIEIEAGLLGIDDINSSLLERGQLRAIWVNQRDADVNEPLFTLVVEARTNQALSEVLSISTTGQSRAYDRDLTPFVLELTFADQGQEAVLLENRPDPFHEETQLEFFLPEAGEYVLEITDTRGKLLRRYRQQAAAGRQQITVFGNDLPSGVLFYTLTFNNRQLSRKMVKL